MPRRNARCCGSGAAAAVISSSSRIKSHGAAYERRTISRVLHFSDLGGNWPVAVQHHVAEYVTFSTHHGTVCASSLVMFEKSKKMNTPNEARVETATKDFKAEVLASNQPVHVEFWAPWSRPCQVFASVLRETGPRPSKSAWATSFSVKSSKPQNKTATA